jgi:hypothetical protein
MEHFRLIAAANGQGGGEAPFKPKTLSGVPYDECISGIQKMIRRGKEEEALVLAQELQCCEVADRKKPPCRTNGFLSPRRLCGGPAQLGRLDPSTSFDSWDRVAMGLSQRALTDR